MNNQEILNIDEEYKQYVDYTLSKNRKVVDIGTYKKLKKKIVNELKNHE